jgi:hypothetical protein
MIRAAGNRRQHPHQSQRPQLPRQGHHHLFAEWREARSRLADGRPRIRPDYRALRPAQ